MDLIDINSPSVSLNVTTTSARATLPVAAANGPTVLIDNTAIGASASADIYVKSGDSTVVATTNDLHIAAGEKAAYKIDPSHTHIAAIVVTGSTTVRFVRATGGA